MVKEMTEERLKKERSFHDERFGGDDGQRKGVEKYYALGKPMRVVFFQEVALHCKSKRVLEYGCGSGESSERWLEYGAELTGIDISPEGVKKAQSRTEKAGYQATFRVMDAEDTDFQDGSFDLVVGSGIIHHLDLERCYKELARVLASDGRAIFVEPLGHNPFINLYRYLTPKMRTEDEHPLKIKDLRTLEKVFQRVDCRFYSLTTFLAVPFTGTPFFKLLFSLFEGIDRLLFMVPFVRRFAWTVIIDAYGPLKKDQV